MPGLFFVPRLPCGDTLGDNGPASDEFPAGHLPPTFASISTDGGDKMRPAKIENWALQVIDAVDQNRPVEDARVELKAEWPSNHAKAARRLAGHANAARGDEILWLIGVDESRGVTGADQNELANWWPQVRSSFESVVPSLDDVAVHTQGETVAALLFETERAPFVVTNPTGQGWVTHETPWREGTSVRSARHEDLIRILEPLSRLPHVDILQASASLEPKEAKEEPRRGNLTEVQRRPHSYWRLTGDIYLTPRTEERVFLPFHKARCRFSVDEILTEAEPESFGLSAPSQITSRGSRLTSHTIRTSKSEVVADGPGRIQFRCGHFTDRQVIDDEPEMLVEFTFGGPDPDSTGVTTCRARLPVTNKDDSETVRWELEK